MKRGPFRRVLDGAGYGLDADFGLDALDAIGGSLADALYQWVKDGRIGGSFVTALLENKLTETFSRADHVNVTKIQAAVQWLYSYAPHLCSGNPLRVSRWIASHDVRRTEEAEDARLDAEDAR